MTCTDPNGHYTRRFKIVTTEDGISYEIVSDALREIFSVTEASTNTDACANSNFMNNPTVTEEYGFIFTAKSPITVNRTIVMCGVHYTDDTGQGDLCFSSSVAWIIQQNPNNDSKG